MNIPIIPLASALTLPPPPAQRLTVQQFNDHLRNHPEPHTCLPGGQPLNLTASGIDLFERLTASFVPQDFHEATVLLWAATRTPQELEGIWSPGAPVDNEESTIRALQPTALMREVVAWRDTVIPPGARVQVINLAIKLFNHEHGTALEVDEAGLPDLPTAEKKSLSAAPTGSSPPSTPSPEGIPSTGPTCSTASPTGSSSPLTEPGSPPMASPPSPPPPEPAAMP